MLKTYLNRLSPKQLYALTVIVFGLFVVDGMVPDVIPFVDEGVLLYTLLACVRMIMDKRATTKGVEPA